MRLWYADRDKLKDVAKGRGKGRGKGKCNRLTKLYDHQCHVVSPTPATTLKLIVSPLVFCECAWCEYWLISIRSKCYEGIDGEDEEGGDDEWSRGRPNADRKDGPWDDIEDVEGTSRIGGRGGSGGLDLADFAAATLKFRSDTRGLGMMDLGDDGRPKAALEDEMEMLFREQKDNILPDNLGDDTEEPEWADAYINNSMHQTAYQPAHDSSSSKRSLLFEVGATYWATNLRIDRLSTHA